MLKDNTTLLYVHVYIPSSLHASPHTEIKPHYKYTVWCVHVSYIYRVCCPTFIGYGLHNIIITLYRYCIVYT